MVLTLRNSLVNAGGFSNMETAEKQVTDVVRVDIHLEATPDGKRYIQRISEIVQLNASNQYPEIDPDNLEYSRAVIDREYYYRKTDRIAFTTREILSYDLDTHTYYTNQRFSEKTENRLKANLDPETRLAFECFMLENWGVPDSIGDSLQSSLNKSSKEKAEIASKAVEKSVLTGALGENFQSEIEHNIESGMDSSEAIKMATNVAIEKAKERIETGDKELVEKLKEVKFEGRKHEEVDLSDEFNLGELDLFSDDF